MDHFLRLLNKTRSKQVVVKIVRWFYHLLLSWLDIKCVMNSTQELVEIHNMYFTDSKQELVEILRRDSNPPRHEWQPTFIYRKSSFIYLVDSLVTLIAY